MDRQASSHRTADGSPDELVLGLVAPLGADLDETITALEEGLRLFHYETRIIRLSEILEDLHLDVELRSQPEAERLRTFMTAGTKARESLGGDVLALGAVRRIREGRPTGDAPSPRTAYVLCTLKHPQEVRTLRSIYGSGFFLVGISASRNDRVRYLQTRRGVKDEDEAKALVRRDEEELQDTGLANEFGQRTRDTFELADVFVTVGDREQVQRFLDLVFGDPFRTPTPDEHAMFIAFATSLRSADLSRQVGSAILSANGDLVAVGANDVAAPGGGLYWPGTNDARDFKLGHDINEKRRDEFVLDTMKRLFRGTQESDEELLQRGRALLKGSPIFDLTEFGRAVHAEMDALLSCARTGVSPRGGTLACTTFPCHNCAKHIIAAGLERVIYVEPYPKSQAYELFSDQIVLDGVLGKHERSDDAGRKVRFSPFSGIGPRRYIDLFSLGLGSGYKIKRKREGGDKVDWGRQAARVRVPMLPNSYLDREKLASQELEKRLKEHHERRQEEPQHREES